ncbi:MAG: hypothetical protein UY92_C0005G0016 [Candidatus Magasanikbacteria bacterium GW2011_GWA2_56_11]|uniref:Uncharacterized protein n=1 Tax=Candidatus Magasanikbacteria bacterium GW2011_GWA2_56_11 TaxID=1619044 RepID=A0A0G2BAP4_9BACT|nr:MAG: hypothetical protein UY92_C0005G0016 [Candidatus Magasanikbacteria bacterium GW2011_GWA2_56_11]
MRRLLFILGFLSIIAAPGAARAQIDQRCWIKTDCLEYRQQQYELSPEQAAAGFVKNSETSKACQSAPDAKGKVDELGFCLPAGSAETKVSFGGQTKFTHIGEFIQFIYQYGIWVAGAFAVVFIIVSGFQWALSGGSSEMIGSAQKRIGGAITGLILLALSYTILHTINPYLVNLRLPQIWLLNPVYLPVEFCNQRPSDLFSYIGNQTVNTELKKGTQPTYDIKFSTNESLLKSKFACGDQLYYKTGGGAVCRGHFCPPSGKLPQMCFRDLFSKKYECKPGQIAGKITNSQWDIPGWKNWESGSDVVDDFEVYIVCASGKTIEIKDHQEKIQVSPGNETGQYLVGLDNQKTFDAGAGCGGKGPDGGPSVIGLVLFPDFDENLDPFDEAHYIGINPTNPNQALDLGDKNTPFFNLILKNENFKGHPAQKFLIPFSAMDKGYTVNIDVGDIKDID